MDYLALFHTQSGAIKFQKALMGKDFEARMLPVPRKLSSSCGIEVKFSSSDEIGRHISPELEKIYEIKEHEYYLIYESEQQTNLAELELTR